MAAHTSNPFRELRLRQGISQYELARRIGCSKHAILRLEQGMYYEPLPSVIDYFISHNPTTLNRLTLLQEYQDFQVSIRTLNSRLLGDLILELTACPVGTHPLTYLRESRGINLTELAKRLCISQSTAGYFEKSPIHQKTVPEQLIHALWDADYTEQETDALKEAYAGYREWVIEQRNPKADVSNEAVA